ncbi:complement component C1q receptor-like [Branchiostoma floridae]|uniref:Complement component C1q receptor-like n=1 Tax=Branchiostoma floridae TaxID=7739 RepID=A0A9J7LUR1_BRAFL|nr:complement component C1q receptor-like [Branchiostoma floridae]
MTYITWMTLALLLVGLVHSGNQHRELDGYRYQMFTTYLNYDQAQATCVSNGGHLAHIKSSRQQSVLANMATLTAGWGSDYWIGLTDRQSEGIWRWTDGTGLIYRNWAEGEPTNGNAVDGEQDCVALWGDYGYTHWDDRQCGHWLYFICQTDINECHRSNGGCSHNCVNTDGSYRCTCRDGYQQSGSSCIDKNECSNNNGGCDQICHNTAGGYHCSCNAGYQLSGSSQCDDIDECTSNPCLNGGTCQDLSEGYRCDCQPGWTGGNCEIDIDECLTNGGRGPCDQTCTNLFGSYRCSCTVEYQLDADSVSCSDLDECDQNLHDCHQRCLNTYGGFSCACVEGFTLNDDGKSCSVLDTDDCFPGACENGGTCVEGNGAFSCNCPPGFKGERCQTEPCSEAFDPPLNGGKACSVTDHATVAMYCTVYCRNNTEFAIAPAQAYTCRADGSWFADSNLVVGQSSPWPDCTGNNLWV